MVERWLQVWRSHHRLYYEAIDDEPARVAAERCFGRNDLPIYRLDEAEVLISFGADFLETWRSPVELTRQYAAFRTPRQGRAGMTMGRAVYLGSHFGLTAANCDEWLALRPGMEASVALSILYVLVHNGWGQPDVDRESLINFTKDYDPNTVAERTGIAAAKIQQLAEWFGKAKGAVALAGAADTTTHTVTFILNAITGNLGKTVQFLDGGPPPSWSRLEDLAHLLTEMKNKTVDTLVIAGANPAFTMPEFAKIAKQVPFVVWIGEVPDETAEHAHLLLPCQHTLESWSDAAPRPDVMLLGQPVMQPVFQNLPLGDILLSSARSAANASDALPWRNAQAAVEATWRDLHSRQGGRITLRALLATSA